MEADEGLTTIETNVAPLTINVVEPATEPDVAVIVTVPSATVVANPVLLMVATVRSPADQVTEFVRSCVLLSVNVPVAVNCWMVPGASV